MRHVRVLFLSLLLGSPVFAAPTISNVTGTFEDAGSVTLTVTGAGTKSPAAPLRWAPFAAGSNPSALGQATSWDKVENMAWDSDEGYNGTGGMKGTAGNGVWDIGVNYTSWNADGQKSYWFRRQKMNFTVTDASQNTKAWRCWPSGGAGYPNIYDAYNVTLLNVEQISGAAVYGGNINPSTTNWVQEECLLKASSSSGVKDASVVRRIDGVQKSSKLTITKSASYPAAMIRNYVAHLVVANKGSWSPGWNTSNNVWYDDIYVDTTWQRVMIGDASTFANCRKFGFVIPATWSNTLVTGTMAFHSSDFPNGVTAYLYLFDSSNANSNGYPITISGSVAGNPTPTITSVNVSTGNYYGGTVSTMTGTGFLSGFSMSVGTVPVASATLNSSTQIRFTIPAGQENSSGHDLQVINTDAKFAILPSTISYTAAPTNQPPYDVSAGPDWEITLPSSILLTGSANDDGEPSGTLTYLWAKKSGPGSVTFGDSTAIQTSAVFSTDGDYTVSMTASDSALSTESATITITVHPVVTTGGGSAGGPAFPFYRQ